MMRLDPDFLMIGEIRDSASAHAAVDAAIRGRVLLSTLHARDAVGTVTALRNWGLPDHEIAESLSVVASQRLVRKLCPACRYPTAPTETERLWLEEFGLSVPRTAWAPGSCDKCNGIGYLGRTAIFELWHLQEGDYQMILWHADEHALRKYFRQKCSSNILQDGLAKVRDGTTTLAEVRTASSGTFYQRPFEAKTDPSRAKQVEP
jgi:general secretion pathway protein E